MDSTSPVARRCTLLLAFLMLLPASQMAAGAEQSLYARMGGEEVIRAVVSDTLDQVVADHQLKRSFEKVDVDRVKRLLVEQICELAGGGCHYSGDSMREVHGGHQISEAEFYGLVQILRDNLKRHHVRQRERNELLVLLAPMKRDVVNVPAPVASTRQP
jgi:hemoglobin